MQKLWIQILQLVQNPWNQNLELSPEIAFGVLELAFRDLELGFWTFRIIVFFRISVLELGPPPRISICKPLSRK